MSLLADLDEFLCGPGDPVERNRHLETVAAFVRAYTRGRGFAADGTPEPEVAAVIVTATARLLANPTGTVSEALGPFNVRHSVFNGFNLVEVLVLNNFRRRAA